jgi:hypothetical protein
VPFLVSDWEKMNKLQASYHVIIPFLMIILLSAPVYLITKNYGHRLKAFAIGGALNFFSLFYLKDIESSK